MYWNHSKSIKTSAARPTFLLCIGLADSLARSTCNLAARHHTSPSWGRALSMLRIRPSNSWPFRSSITFLPPSSSIVMKCKAHAVGRWSEVSHAPQGIEPSHSTGCLGHINANLVGIKNNPDGGNPTGLIKAGNDLLSRGGSIIGAAGLTAVFGMGTGVTPPLWSPASVSSGCRQWRHEFGGWSDVAGSVSRHATETLHQSSALRSNEPNDPAQAACADRRRIAGRSDEAIDR